MMMLELAFDLGKVKTKNRRRGKGRKGYRKEGRVKVGYKVIMFLYGHDR